MLLPQRLHQIMIALSQLANTLIWVEDTWADEMLSAKVYRLGWTWLVLVLDGLWFWQRDPGHCQRCYNEEVLRFNSPEEYRGH